MKRSVPPKKSSLPKRASPPKKKTPKKYTCVACSDTGLDSRGSPCYPCSVRKANLLKG